MTVDNTKAKFSSLWDIDQQITKGTLAISIGNTTIYTFSDSARPPEYEAQFKPTGSSNWYDIGMSSTNTTLAGIFTFSSYVSGTNVIVTTSITGTVRYFVYEDKLNNG